ncbi:Oidioi.mRNA.OKI2018_I69.XSR.g13383.t1.cds [Oikopleura dioica]|uniref:Oidioi.mRNA.OKI2018_I69.XSR.g13383.t1.cds n=1 Tax=Oikopleura dioica TaxID=34765 RepID=A0ABN7SAK4_OIKDI|nr:Oidioi.mRNA.OKI2018_I69.XSR.g13383.t1.cds [Oikopleura dioica]
MQQMINLDEKRETVTISAFPEYTWVDQRLKWEPKSSTSSTWARQPVLPSPEQHTINMPVEKIWQPSIILYSNTDGIYDPTVPVMAPVKSSGRVHWMPPGIFRTKCKIDVSLFPFDWQNCSMAFRTYNYDKNEVQLAARDTQETDAFS